MLLFGTGKLIALPQRNGLGLVVPESSPVVIGSAQEITVDMDADIKTLYGAGRYALGVAQGRSKVEIKAKYASLDAGILGRLQFGKQASAGIRSTVNDFSCVLPTGAAGSVAPVSVVIEPPQDGSFVADLGIFDGATGEQLERVPFDANPVPAAGQYTLKDGTYRFAPSTNEREMMISYEYRATGGKGQLFELTNELMGPSPSFTLVMKAEHDGRTLSMRLNRVVSSKVTLPFKSDDFATFELNGQAFADERGQLGYICLS
jgi:hypothetical protein